MSVGSMKELYTENKNDDYTFSINFAYCEQNTFDNLSGYETHFRLVFIPKASGIVRFDTFSIPIIDSCCICLNETEKPEIELNENSLLHVLYFKPATINTEFNFENIRTKRSSLSNTAMLDVFWLNPFLQRTEEYSGLINPGIACTAGIARLYSKIKGELLDQETPQWPCKSRSFLFELLNLVNNLFQNPVLAPMASFANAGQEVKNLIVYLNAQYHQKLTLSGLCYHFNTNRTTLTEKFKKIMNMSIFDYLSKIRIQMACSFLRDTNLPVYEITDRVGYEDKTHFRRVFRKITGYTPSDYRKKFQPLRIY